MDNYQPRTNEEAMALHNRIHARSTHFASQVADNHVEDTEDNQKALIKDLEEKVHTTINNGGELCFLCYTDYCNSKDQTCLGDLNKQNGCEIYADFIKYIESLPLRKSELIGAKA
tara:strand:- start:341 stop:685 length:345 start_codon:yes stop_codon:yes gene_type:complete